MAERRMFAKTIVLSDAFLDMPMSARCLYFTLGMFADDDGFINNPKSIMRQCGASNDDMNILIMRKFVITFEDGVMVIKHWRVHNYIQKDRYVPTKYKEHKEELGLDENNSYTLNGIIEVVDKKPLSPARQKRLDAIKESELPYSFNYKIKNAFIGEKCPICGCIMGVCQKEEGDPISVKNPMPTIQHNVPISKGGKHEIDNISVICSHCNLSIQDNITGDLNNELVKQKWNDICKEEGNVSGMDTQVRLGKDRLVKSNIYNSADATASNISEIISYLNEKANTNYRASSENTKKHIKARLNEKYTIDDFKTVIDKKCAEWGGTDMAKYLRPDTLFGTKFESYLNQKIIKRIDNAAGDFEQRDYNNKEVDSVYTNIDDLENIIW